ncbi:MAG: InlB B-repeat-containing protein [Clostridia bacterium]|nr:InlB B-repeat-containing protein [Clostridia bacterium]
MKKLLMIISLVAVLSLMLSLAAFAQGNKATVTFDSDGGSAVDPITVDKNSKLTQPQAPTKLGFDFAGWYVLRGEDVELQEALKKAEKDGEQLSEKDLAALKAVDENDEEWSFVGYVVTEDMTLVAKWVPNDEMPPMEFKINGGNFLISLGYMGKGLIGIFVVTLVIIGVVATLNWHGRSLEKRNQNKE